MKKTILTILVMAFAVPAFACDESCQKDRASAKNNVEFPGYLSWKFCEDTKASFMEGDIPSLESYRNKRLNSKYKVRMKNIKTFVEQRKEWLQECDQYLDLTDHGRIFKDEKTTEKVFAAMDAVSSELDSLLQGVTYVTEEGGSDTDVIAGKFDALFQVVDDHKTVMMLDRQFVAQ